MKTNHNPEILAAATSLLRGAAPDLTPSMLLEALQNRQPTQKISRKMLTLREFCNLAQLSMPTVFRMIKRGELKTILIGQRNRRIPANVAEEFLNGSK